MSNEAADAGVGDAIAALGKRRAGRPVRKGVRGVDPREAEPREATTREAPTRAAGEKRLTRTRNRVADKFDVPARVKADGIARGLSYEWKRIAVRGMPDTDHMLDLQSNHWSPVPKDRYSNYAVEKQGMIMMERPLYLTQEAQREDYDLAMADVYNVTKGAAETPQGHFPRNHPNARRVSGIGVAFNDGLTVDPGSVESR